MLSPGLTRVSVSSEIIIKTMPGQYDLLALTKALPERYPFFLESSASGDIHHSSNIHSRYDILFAFPQDILAKNHRGQLFLNQVELPATSFLTALNQQWRKYKHDIHHDELPFTGGWFLFLSYELVKEIEPVLDIQHFDERLPVAQAVRIPAAIIYDRKKKITLLVSESEYSHYLDDLESDLKNYHGTPPGEQVHVNPAEEEPERYLKNISRVLDYIKEGDVFQVNLSRLWQAACHPETDPISLYQNLRQSNPAPFSALVRIDDTYILSSSPERLLRVKNKICETRPIAGTRPRGNVDEEDISLKDELIDNLKERAEHIMLIDLERNDLGRVCQPGSVQVTELMGLESYAHVHHIVSNVVGKLKNDIEPGDVIAAVFPGGTITGCPKVRCMQIIQELEDAPRGAYTGSIGYLNRNGDMDLNILIRTIVMHDKNISFRAGAGLVADSDPIKELEETRFKAKGMALALNR